MGLYDFTFYDLIHRNAICFNDAEAWFEADDNRSVTFNRFKELVDRLACGLQKSGIKKGDRIGVLGKNSLEYFLLYGGAAALGAIILPINWRLSAGEIIFNLNECCGPENSRNDEQEGYYQKQDPLNGIDAQNDPCGNDGYGKKYLKGQARIQGEHFSQTTQYILQRRRPGLKGNIRVAEIHGKIG